LNPGFQTPDFPKDDKFFTINKDGSFFIKECGTRLGSLFSPQCQEIPVAQFGTIRLGQLAAYGGKVTLTMLQVKLGCPIVGTVSLCDASTNGGDI
jgi:hypothetical protein